MPGASAGPYWTNLTAPRGPSARELEALAYDAADRDVVMFGGGNWGNSTDLADTWTFAAGEWTEHNLSVTPPPMLGAMMAYDAKDGYAVLYGGLDRTAGTFQSSTYIWSNGTWTDVSSQQSSWPSARWLGGLVYDAKDQCLVLFGGGDFAQYYNDTWEFRGGRWTQLTQYPGNTWPAARSDVNMAYDPATGSVILNSGSNAGPSINDTWSFAGGNWTKLTPNSAARSYSAAALAYSPQFGGLVRWGGTLTDNSTWSFASGNWTNRSLRPFPPMRVHPAMVYDAADGYDLLMGGAVNGPQTVQANDTWAYSSSRLFGLLTTPHGEVDVGTNLTLHARAYPAPSSISVTYLGLPPGCLARNTTLLNCAPTTRGMFNVSANFTAPGGLYNRTSNLTINVTAYPTIRSFNITPAEVTLGHSITVRAVLAGGAAPFQYVYSQIPAGCQPPNGLNFTCTPTSSGQFNVTLTVTDASSVVVSAVAPLSVNPRPSISSLTISPSAIDLGEAVHMRAVATGGTGGLTYMWAHLPSNCTTANSSVLTCVPGPGTSTYLVNVTIVDAEGFWARAFSTLVVNIDPTVVGASVTPGISDVTDTVTLRVDPMGGTAPYSFRWSGLPAGCASQNLSQFSCDPTAAGTFAVNITVTDSRQYAARAGLTLRVNPLPGSARLETSANETDVRHSVVFTLTFSGGTAPYRIDWTGLPAGCTNANLSAISCTPVTPGLSIVQGQVIDSWNHSAQAQAQLIVRPPVAITAFNSTFASVTTGETTVLAVAISGGAAPIAFVYTGLPPGCTTVDSSQLTCTPTGAGAFAVAVTATDADGESANATTPIRVSATASSQGFLGLPTLDWGILGGIVAIAIVLAVLALGRSRRRPPTPRAAPVGSIGDAGADSSGGSPGVSGSPTDPAPAGPE